MIAVAVRPGCCIRQVQDVPSPAIRVTPGEQGVVPAFSALPPSHHIGVMAAKVATSTPAGHGLSPVLASSGPGELKTHAAREQMCKWEAVTLFTGVATVGCYKASAAKTFRATGDLQEPVPLAVIRSGVRKDCFLGPSPNEKPMISARDSRGWGPTNAIPRRTTDSFIQQVTAGQRRIPN